MLDQLVNLHSVTLCNLKTFIKFVNLESLMVHLIRHLFAKKKIVNVLAIYGHDAHLCHVTDTLFYILRRLHIKFDFD